MSSFMSKSGLAKIVTVTILIIVILVGGSFGLGYSATRQPAMPTASPTPSPTVNFLGGNSIVQSFDGGYMIAGYTTSPGGGNATVYLVKTDSSGNMVWSKTY